MENTSVRKDRGRLYCKNTKYISKPKSLRLLYDDFQKELGGSSDTPKVLRACVVAAIRLRAPEHARFYIRELDQWEAAYPGSEDPEFRKTFLLLSLKWASLDDRDFCRELYRGIPRSSLNTKVHVSMILFLRKEPSIAAEYVRMLVAHDLAPTTDGMLRVALWLCS